MKKFYLLMLSCIAMTLSYGQVLQEGFDGGTIPAGWTQEYVSAAEDWAAVTTNGNGTISPRSGSHMAEFRTSTSGDATKLVTPSMNLTTLSSPQLTFYYANVQWAGDIDELRVYYKTSAAGAWTQIGSDYLAEQTSWTEVVLALPNPSADYYVAFEATSNWARGMNLDDVLVDDAPTCIAPSALTASNILGTSADLGWTDNTGGTASQWDIEIGLAGFTPTGNATYSGVANPYSAMGLTPATSYEYYVRADCGGGDKSAWTGPFAFTTPQIPVSSYPYTQDWEAGQGSWQTMNGSQTNKWQFGAATNNGGTNAMYISQDGGTSNTYSNSSTSIVHLFRDFQVAPGNPFIQLSFDWQCVGEGGYDYMRVYVAPTTYTPTAGTNVSPSGTAPTGIIQLGGDYDSQTGYSTETFTLDPSYSGTTFRIIFEWRNDNLFGSNPPAAVDNINMQVASCGPPANLSVANITTTDVDVDWDPAGPELYWNIQYGTSGFAIGSGTIWDVTVASDTTIDNLTQNTDYDVYVQAVCGTNDTSIWIGPISFTTDAVCPAPTNFQTTYIAEDTIAFDWTNGGTETMWTLEYGVVGFTPGTGTTVSFDSNPDTLFTVPVGDVYEFILYADCGTMTNNPYDGPISIAIPDPNIGFLAWDSTCTTPFEDISATGQNIAATIGDDGSTGFTLPFTFQLDDQISNQISVGNNGGVVFGTLAGTVGFTNGTIASLGQNGFYPFWDDLGTTGNVYYEVVGTAPNRRAIVQWNRAPFGGTSLGNLQLVMYEGTNEFRFVYDNVDFGDPANDFGASATVGTKTNINNAQVSYNDAVINNGKCISWYYESCPMVLDVNITGVNTDSVFFTITPKGNETEWKVEYGPAGFTPGTGMFFITNTTTDTIPGLDQYTEYDFYVYSACSAGDTSMAYGPLNFWTDPVCPAPTNFQNTYVASDTLVFDWTNGGTETMWNIEYGPVGFTPGTGTVVAFDTNPDTLFNLADGMVYDFVLYSDCGGATNNPYDGPISVATPIVNDSTCFATDIVYDSTYTFSNVGATIHPME
ncbi:MAG: fibronectin type III domain-containing protein, partial [Crocinitomicaceae bacterium]